MAQQLSVNIPSVAVEDGAGGSVNLDADEETKSFVFTYLSRRAQNDKDLNKRDAEVIQNRGAEVVQTVAGTESCDAATNVAHRLADIGDEIDSQYEPEMKEIVEMVESPEVAFSIFLDVVKNLFEVDSAGGAKFSVGRIAALMTYCYHLVKKFIFEKMASSGIIFSFMCMVAGWVFKVFVKAKFYEWLQSQGGWGQLLVSGTASTFNWGRNMYLIVGIASLSLWAFSYFRK